MCLVTEQNKEIISLFNSRQAEVHTVLISFRKQWKKATEAERIGLDTLQTEKKKKSLRKQEERTHKNRLLQKPVQGWPLTARRVGASACP